MKKKVILPTMLALSILVIGILASTNVSAQTENYPPIVSKIAQKFNLKVSDVQSVYDEDRETRRAEMFARFSERLDDLIAAGKISEEQKDRILEKHEEMQNKIDQLKDITGSEKRAKLKQIKTEFRTWLTDQGLENVFGMSKQVGYMHGFKMGLSQ